ncbi:serine hydrolase domain-containing protein [Sphingosinicella sp.]|uniref:serine hydrolase domain-containing protein n=1 Tax=Sphingosinicella sp. TaxID=1917971 RepID=UPI0035AD7B29
MLNGSKASAILATLLFLLNFVLTPAALGATPPGLGSGDIPSRDIDDLFLKTISQEPVAMASPGAQVAVVFANGDVYTKGYGVSGAPTHNRPPMDPERHLLRIASLTKMFTAVGILQLYEREKLDLDTDINRYLKAFHVHNPYGGKVVTVRQLLQHTSGLDEDWAGMSLRSPNDHAPLADVFKRRGVRFARPTGEVMGYTNRAYMLLGHLIEAVSGLSYETYVQRHILDVLEMDNSTFVLTKDKSNDLAWGTEIEGNAYTEVWIPDTLTRPAGDLMTNAVDMSHFVKAMLGNGRYRDNVLLKPETLELMKSECRLLGKGLPGFCLGLATSVHDGLRYWLHAGNHPGYNSFFALDPARGYGIFYGFNGGVDVERFYADFLERLVPTKALRQLPQSLPILRTDIAGDYRSLRPSSETPEKLLFLHKGDTRVEIKGGELIIPPVHFVQVAPLLFYSKDFQAYAKVLLNDAGEVQYIQEFVGGLRKLAWYETQAFQLGILCVCVGFILVFLVLETAGAVRQSRINIYNLAGVSAGILWLTGIGVWYFYPMNSDNYAFGFPSYLLLGLTVIKWAATMTIIAIPAAIFSWFAGGRQFDLRNAFKWLALLAMLILISWSKYWKIL